MLFVGGCATLTSILRINLKKEVESMNKFTELTTEEQQNVNGGFVPVWFVPSLVAVVIGFFTVGATVGVNNKNREG